MSAEASNPRSYFLFPDTTQVLWAEEVAQEEGIPVEVVPAPVESDDLCGLAIRTLPQKIEAFIALLDEEGIEFRRHSGS